MFNVT